MSKTLYFIPGTMCDQRLWLPAWQLLHQQYQHEHSLVHVAIPTTGTLDKIVEHLASKIIDDKAILVGFSLGGYIACAIALKLGNKLSQLLVVANFPKNLPDAEIKQRKRTIAWIRQQGYSGIPNKRINDLLAPSMAKLAPEHYQDIKQCIVAMDRELGVDVLLHQLSMSMYRPNLLPLLTQLSLPISFLVGENDSLISLATLRLALERADNIELNTAANTGHMLPLESPQAFASKLIHLMVT